MFYSTIEQFTTIVMYYIKMRNLKVSEHRINEGSRNADCSELISVHGRHISNYHTVPHKYVLVLHAN